MKRMMILILSFQLILMGLLPFSEVNGETGGNENLYAYMDLEDKKKLLHFLREFTYLIYSFDINNYQDKELLEFALTQGIFDDSPGSFSFKNEKVVTKVMEDGTEMAYYEVPSDKVDYFLYRLFGVIPKKQPRYNDEGEFPAVLYENEHYYFAKDVGFGLLPYSIQIAQMSTLNKDLYYIEFDVYDYHGGDDDFLREPMDTWTDEQKDSVELLNQGYAIVKAVSIGGENAWNLVAYQEDERLSDKELERYQRKKEQVSEETTEDPEVDDENTSMISYFALGVGAILLAGIGWFLLRRKK